MTIMSEQEEWDDLLAQVPLDATTGEAAAKLLALLNDAVQAQRPWAKDRLNEAVLAGLSKTWRAHVQKQRPKLKTRYGNVKQVGGAKRRRVDGNVIHVQIPFDLMTFEELAQHRDMEARNRRALAENVKAQDRLLALHDKVPSAKTPAEACRKLGLDPADVMAGAA